MDSEKWRDKIEGPKYFPWGLQFNWLTENGRSSPPVPALADAGPDSEPCGGSQKVYVHSKKKRD
jgi:hypothetical protein